MFGWIGEKWESSRLRRWINDNPKLVVVVVCVSALVLAVSVLPLQVTPIAPIEPAEHEWYYDLNTGELFVGAKGLAVPTEAPSGPLPNGEPAGVRACVLSYVLEPDESERYIGFIEKPEPNAKEVKGDKWEEGKLIRRVGDEEWFSVQSEEGRAIMETAFVADIDGERPSYVRAK